MLVTLIAKTTTVDENIQKSMSGYTRSSESTDAEYLISASGRNCYRSFHRPNEATADDKDYIRRTVGQLGHASVSEHASATFLIEGVSRNLTHELVRHRMLSFSQRSQRFADESQQGLVLPPAIRDENPDTDPQAASDELLDIPREQYADIVDTLTEKGYTRKQAREAARAVLPGGTETEIVVTGNHRAWYDVLTKRLSAGADAEIRELAEELYRQLYELAPSIYEGLK